MVRVKITLDASLSSNYCMRKNCWAKELCAASLILEIDLRSFSGKMINLYFGRANNISKRQIVT